MQPSSVLHKHPGQMQGSPHPDSCPHVQEAARAGGTAPILKVGKLWLPELSPLAWRCVSS